MRAKGEGSIRQRPNGLWQASLQSQGKRRYVYGKTRQEVVKKLAALKHEDSPSHHTLRDLTTAWLGTKELKPSTLKDYRDSIRLYLSPLLDMSLAELTPQVIEQHYALLQRQGRRRGALKAHTCLHQCLALAHRWGWIRENPLQHIRTPQYTPKVKEMWSEDELRTFLEGIKGLYLEPLYLLLLASGCRLGEALGLTWEDVGEGEIRVVRSVQRLGGERIVLVPKTLTGRRRIAVPQDVLDRLVRRHESWVFVGERGDPLEASSVQGNMRRTCEQLGIRAMTPHGLRHLHASILLQRGMSVPQVSKRLGHADASTTLRIYAHVLGDDQSEAVDVMRDVLNTS